MHEKQQQINVANYYDTDLNYHICDLPHEKECKVKHFQIKFSCKFDSHGLMYFLFHNLKFFLTLLILCNF